MKATAALICALTLPCDADWTKEATPPRLGPHPRLAPQRLDYQLSWKAMLQAGKLSFTLGARNPRSPGDFIASASGGSRGLAAKLHPYQVDLRSRLDPATLRPRSFTGTEDEGKEVVTTRSVWSGNTVKSTETTRDTKTGSQSEKKGSFTHPGIHDIFSCLLHVRSHSLANGSTLVMPLQPFDKPYLARIHVQGREKLGGRDAIRMSVSLQKIDPATKRLKPYKKLKNATLWISDDRDRVPLEIRSAVFIGDVRMTLTGTQPL